MERVTAHPRISVLTGAEVRDVSGYLGQYRTTVRLAGGSEEQVQSGVIVVATGARQMEPREYLFGDDAGVMSQREFEELVSDLDIELPGSVVMVQCVGSRDDAHPYCSRICCTEAIKNALAIKERSPATDVTILFRDIRTFGFKERYYREARRKGVVFLQYDADAKPQVRRVADRLAVEVAVQPEGELLTLDADLLVLSAGIEPNPDSDELARLLKVPLNEDGFFMEAHVKLRPLDFAADGLFLCGLAHSPRFLDETIAQANGAAVRAVSLLSRDQLDATPIVASVNPRLCAACGICVEVCPFSARVLEPGASCAEVIEVLCQGCGACIAACPNKASQQKGFEMAQVQSMIDAAALELVW
jgi:heterodisulfide reductase subunit A-like polyferredoxin